jgi:hypothetical protein
MTCGESCRRWDQGTESRSSGGAILLDAPNSAKMETAMASKWYYSLVGPPLLGPVSGRRLKQLAAKGKLLPTHRVRKDSMEKSVRAGRLKGLFFPPVE